MRPRRTDRPRPAAGAEPPAGDAHAGPDGEEVGGAADGRPAVFTSRPPGGWGRPRSPLRPRLPPLREKELRSDSRIAHVRTLTSGHEMPTAAPDARRRRPPRYAPGPSLRLGVLALRLSVSYDAREYFTGVYSGDVDLRPGADLPRLAPGMIFSLDLGPVRVDGGFVQTAARRRLDMALSYEEKTFAPGETVDILAQAGWLDVTYRLRLAGDEGARTGISALLGIDAPRIKLAIESGEASAREGFNASWPVLALGLEAHAWLTDRIQLRGSLLGPHGGLRPLLHGRHHGKPAGRQRPSDLQGGRRLSGAGVSILRAGTLRRTKDGRAAGI